MAQINARGIGRLSHIVHLEVPPGAPITLDEAMAELREAFAMIDKALEITDRGVAGA